MLDEEPVEMRLDRSRRHPELRGDLLIGKTRGDELENLLLPRSEMRAPTFVRRVPSLHSLCPLSALYLCSTFLTARSEQRRQWLEVPFVRHPHEDERLPSIAASLENFAVARAKFGQLGHCFAVIE